LHYVLEANPNLTWRDVQGVLISSSVLTDSNHNYWTTNGAGYYINHQYGFGRINATGAVDTASKWVNLPTTVHLLDSHALSVSSHIPDRGLGTFSTSWTCSYSFIVEHVEILVDISHAHRGQLNIQLTSPQGTISTLAETHGDNNPDYAGWKFMTIRNWGENSQGTWQLTITDGSSGTTGTLNAWQLKIYTH